MVDPPSLAGAVNATLAEVPVSAVAAPIVGAPGTVAGGTLGGVPKYKPERAPSMAM